MTSHQLIRGSKRVPDTDVVSAALILVLEAHNAALKADLEKLEATLAAERERADRAVAAIESRAQRLDGPRQMRRMCRIGGLGGDPPSGDRIRPKFAS